MRSPILFPASANTSNGADAPRANATVSTTVDQPMSPVAPATVTAASTGPAQGTYTAPSAMPTTKPPRPRALFCRNTGRGRYSKGLSTRCPSCGTIMPSPTSTNRVMPIQRRIPVGKPRAPSTTVPSKVMAEKLSAMPATTRKGRARSPVVTANTTGSTGRMHGEIPVTTPPIRPIAANSHMVWASSLVIGMGTPSITEPTGRSD